MLSLVKPRKATCEEKQMYMLLSDTTIPMHASIPKTFEKKSTSNSLTAHSTAEKYLKPMKGYRE